MLSCWTCALKIKNNKRALALSHSSSLSSEETVPPKNFVRFVSLALLIFTFEVVKDLFNLLLVDRSWLGLRRSWCSVCPAAVKVVHGHLDVPPAVLEQAYGGSIPMKLRGGEGDILLVYPVVDYPMLVMEPFFFLLVLFVLTEEEGGSWSIENEGEHTWCWRSRQESGPWIAALVWGCSVVQIFQVWREKSEPRRIAIESKRSGMESIKKC